MSRTLRCEREALIVFRCLTLAKDEQEDLFKVLEVLLYAVQSTVPGKRTELYANEL
jgi:hypothetical protein